jgi:hypothetical protein
LSALQLPRLTLAAGALTLMFSALLPPGGLRAADTEQCARKAKIHLSELKVSEEQVDAMRLIERVRIDDRAGSDVAGIDAWVRLKSCKGWLVINMSPSCFIRQSYTRGDCHVEGLSNY